MLYGLLESCDMIDGGKRANNNFNAWVVLDRMAEEMAWVTLPNVQVCTSKHYFTEKITTPLIFSSLNGLKLFHPSSIKKNVYISFTAFFITTVINILLPLPQ